MIGDGDVADLAEAEVVQRVAAKVEISKGSEGCG
jgi:hypothetical protein